MSRLPSEVRNKIAVAECMVSLAKAVQDAGGAMSAIDLDKSLGEFIAEVAGQNNIRFRFIEPKEKPIVPIKLDKENKELSDE